MRMCRVLRWVMGIAVLAMVTTAFAAYHHMGEIDSGIFLSNYPDKAGTKLDSCTLCHSGGSYESGGKPVTLGSCQWCHYSYGYDASGDIDDTLNSYGKAYKASGRNSAALKAIESQDSDGDGSSNKIELDALRFPGDPNDDPSKVPAPFRVFSRAEIEALLEHSQVLLLNASKSTDFYARYTGVTVEELLSAAGIRPEATNIKVFAPDGFSQFFSLKPDPNNYHVIGDYPPGSFHYDEQADVDRHPADGWCDYSSPAVAGLADGDPIQNPDGLKLMLAYLRDGANLTPGVLGPQNKLDGEGPFRVVPPQKVPGPPDQRSTAADQAVRWPYNFDNDHNAGYSPRSATIVKVEPLPPGTTDIDTLEAGWGYIDQSKIVVYGAIDPKPTIQGKLKALTAMIRTSEAQEYKRQVYKPLLLLEVCLAERLAACGKYKAAMRILEKAVLPRTDGCSTSALKADANDWVVSCELQKKIYWSLHELKVLIAIIV